VSKKDFATIIFDNRYWQTPKRRYLVVIVSHVSLFFSDCEKNIGMIKGAINKPYTSVLKRTHALYKTIYN